MAVTPAPLSISAAAKNKQEGQSDPALTYSASGLRNGDVLSGALARDAGESPGEYQIRQGSLSAGTNYLLSYTGNQFSITALPAPAPAPAADAAIEKVIHGAQTFVTPAPAEVAAAVPGNAINALPAPAAGTEGVAGVREVNDLISIFRGGVKRPDRSIGNGEASSNGEERR